MNNFVPFTLTAHLRQDIAMHPITGIALDGILASQLRAQRAARHNTAASVADNGLHTHTPYEWDLPLAKCEIAGEHMWHWLTTTGQLANPDGTTTLPATESYPITNRFDEQRAPHTTIKIPQHISTKEGKFRNKITPLPTILADTITWQAVGDPDTVWNLISPLTAIGGRRGIGHGTVNRWTIETATPKNAVVFGHTHPNGKPGRPLPTQCAHACRLPLTPIGPSGLRPPLFHPAQQHLLVIPS